MELLICNRVIRLFYALALKNKVLCIKCHYEE